VGSVSVTPIPAVPDEPGSATTAAPQLRLVAGHEHSWQLRAVEYDEAFEVRRYECGGCDEVLFR